MFRKSYSTIFFAAVLLLAGQIAVYSQFESVSGKVELEKADGTREPVVGAAIDVYRTDIKSGSPSGKTNKKGEFSFAGMLLGAQYAFSVSAPNCTPTIFPNIKAGDAKVLITLKPGDGKKWTEAEVRKAIAAGTKTSTTTAAGGGDTSSGGGQPEAEELTAEEKEARAKAQAEYDAKVAKRDKTLKANEVVALSLKEGNEALNAGNYDLAIAKYDQGIAADPDFVASVPILNTNRAIALRSRASEEYNKAVKITEPTEKVAQMAKVKKDFADASRGFVQSWDLLKSCPPPEGMSKEQYDGIKLKTLAGAQEIFEKAVRTEQVDQPTIDAAKVLIPEYVTLESDPAKKRLASLTLGDLFRVSNDSENAVAAYMKVLEASPDDVDALAGAGLQLVNVGYINNDKTKMQEGANLLQKFAGIAPDTHRFKADALALIENLKKEQNVTPQKVTSTPKATPKATPKKKP